jgi:hypothetical protein
VLFRFWLLTSLIVAFVAYCGAFGIRLTGPMDQHAAYADRIAAYTVLNDDDRGR